MFWSNSAGPSALQVWNPFDKGDRILRVEPAKKPAPWKGIEQPALCNSSHATEVATFLSNHYRGSDWTLDCTPEWILRCMNGGALVLSVRDTYSKELLGIIFSRPLGGNLIGVGSKSLQDVRVIEGLCVRSDRRGLHLAGWLIAWADYYTSQHKPTIHVWFREVDRPPSFGSTHIQSEQYVYIKTNLVVLDTVLMLELDYDVWSSAWLSQGSTLGCAYSDGIYDHEDLVCFSTPESIPCNIYSMVVLLDTHRRSLKGEKIWEVLWCPSTNAYKRLNGVAFQLQQSGRGGILFATDAKERGGAKGGWPSPWVSGRAGIHLTYFYNYLPPTRSVNLVALRGCI